jgi:uncharacterized protein (TIGR02588 family)
MNKNALEWTVFGASLVLVVACAGLLVHQHFTRGNRPPSIVMSASTPVETAGGYAVPVDVRNDGDLTAEDVRIEATLSWSGGREHAQATLPLVPYRSERRAWIAFTRNPADGELRMRVLGYTQP